MCVCVCVSDTVCVLLSGCLINGVCACLIECVCVCVCVLQRVCVCVTCYLPLLIVGEERGGKGSRPEQKINNNHGDVSPTTSTTGSSSVSQYPDSPACN